MDAMNYEMLIREAFALANNCPCERFGDPASLANTDVFDNHTIIIAKSAAVYAVAIFNNEIFSAHKEEAEHGRISEFIERIGRVEDITALANAIDDYKNSVLKIYFKYVDGIPVLL